LDLGRARYDIDSLRIYGRECQDVNLRCFRLASMPLLKLEVDDDDDDDDDDG